MIGNLSIYGYQCSSQPVLGFQNVESSAKKIAMRTNNKSEETGKGRRGRAPPLPSLFSFLRFMYGDTRYV